MSDFIVGLTGGIGSGKTAVSDRFAKLGIGIVDADVIAREVVLPGTDGLNAIEEHFGANILGNDGALDRAALRERIFANPKEREWLEQLLHPLIRKEMQRQCQRATSDYCILSVPLLIENGLDSMVDQVLVVDVDESIQRSRAAQRDGNSEAQINAIMASQASRRQRLDKATQVIDNNGKLENLDVQVEELDKIYAQMSHSVVKAE